MKRKAEGDGAKRRWANALRLGRSPEPEANQNSRARTKVRNQAFSSPTTPRFAHTGEKNCGKHENEETLADRNAAVFEDQLISPFPSILVKQPARS